MIQYYPALYLVVPVAGQSKAVSHVPPHRMRGLAEQPRVVLQALEHAQTRGLKQRLRFRGKRFRSSLRVRGQPEALELLGETGVVGQASAEQRYRLKTLSRPPLPGPQEARKSIPGTTDEQGLCAGYVQAAPQPGASGSGTSPARSRQGCGVQEIPLHHY